MKVVISDVQIEVDFSSDHDVCRQIIFELQQDCYRIKNIDFKPGDVVIDAGANIGLFSIFIAKKFPFIKVYAYEAMPEIFNILKKNIYINQLSNITATNYALGPRDFEFVYLFTGMNSGGAFVGGKANKIDQINVETISLNSVLDRNKIERVKLLKMDIEGAEYDVLYACQVLDKIEYFSAELHGGIFKNKKLLDYLKIYINKDKIAIDKEFIRDFLFPVQFYLMRVANGNEKIKNVLLMSLNLAKKIIFKVFRIQKL